MLPAYPQGYGYYTPYQLAPSPPPPQLSPLIWTPAAAKLDSNGRLLAIAALLRQMRYSPMDFVIALLGQGPEFDTFRKGFYDSQGLEQLLNVMESNKRGVAKLRTCIRPRAIKLVKEEVYLEMEELTSYTHMSTNDITPQFLMTFDLRKENETFADTAPVLHDVLMTSCQTDRSASENKLKKPETVCFLPSFFDCTLTLATVLHNDFSPARQISVPK
jgi:hypothetical protein